jgi:hypothetical protein
MGRLCRKELLIYNFEDPLIDQVYEYGRDIGQSGKEFNILVLRDAYNLFASRLAGLKNFRRQCRVSPVLKTIWKTHAREFLEETSFLNGKVCLSFNRFVESTDYRRGLALSLGLREPEFSACMTQEGGGSSFDRGAEVNLSGLTSRFLDFAEDPLYLDLFRNDHELYDLNMRIFGESLRPHEDALRRLLNQSG